MWMTLLECHKSHGILADLSQTHVLSFVLHNIIAPWEAVCLFIYFTWVSNLHPDNKIIVPLWKVHMSLWIILITNNSHVHMSFWRLFESYQPCHVPLKYICAIENSGLIRPTHREWMRSEIVASVHYPSTVDFIIKWSLPDLGTSMATFSML